MKRVSATTTKNKTGKNPAPSLKWQTGAYNRNIEIKCILPYQFLLLCKLMDITPEQLITDFMDNLSCGSWKRKGRDEAKKKLIDYFIEHGYGQHHYAVEDIRAIFREMDAIGMLWPQQANTEFVERHAQWVSEYHTYWFNKWFHVPARRVLSNKDL